MGRKAVPHQKAAEQVRLAERRASVARLYREGWMQSEIAAELGVTQATVSNDLKRAREEWRRAMAEDVAAVAALQMAKLRQVERNAWAAWERSQRPLESVATERNHDEVGGAAGGDGRPMAAGPERARAMIRRDGQNGDARFLRTVLDVHDRIARLHGLDKLPRQVLEVHDRRRERPIEEMTDEELLAIIEQEKPCHPSPTHEA